MHKGHRLGGAVRAPADPGEAAAAIGAREWRVELNNVPGYKYIQIHVENYPSNSHGCFLPGITKGANFVEHSKTALEKMRAIAEADGSNQIIVRVTGSNTKP